MTSNRKVRKDFDLAKEYSVDVSNCTEEEKKEVQQAFFDVGILWGCGSDTYQHLGASQYSNAHTIGKVAKYCMFGDTTEDCNMTAEQFLDLVYEPEVDGHIHAEAMLQYAQDAKAHAEPWKLWQFKSDTGFWLDCHCNPIWSDVTEYRHKPKTHFVHGVEIPDLRIKEEPAPYTKVACVDPLEPRLFTIGAWSSSWHADNCKRLLNLGMLYEYTPEGQQAAIQHAKAWLGENL